MDLDIIEEIKSNLNITVEQLQTFGPCETVNVKLFYGDELLSESECTLPENS